MLRLCLVCIRRAEQLALLKQDSEGLAAYVVGSCKHYICAICHVNAALRHIEADFNTYNLDEKFIKAIKTFHCQKDRCTRRDTQSNLATLFICRLSQEEISAANPALFMDKIKDQIYNYMTKGTTESSVPLEILQFVFNTRARTYYKLWDEIVKLENNGMLHWQCRRPWFIYLQGSNKQLHVPTESVLEVAKNALHNVDRVFEFVLKALPRNGTRKAKTEIKEEIKEENSISRSIESNPKRMLLSHIAIETRKRQRSEYPEYPETDHDDSESENETRQRQSRSNHPDIDERQRKRRRGRPQKDAKMYEWLGSLIMRKFNDGVEVDISAESLRELGKKASNNITDLLVGLKSAIDSN